MKRLVNKVALVTGASNGIGRATAERFVREGAKVVIADHNEERAEKLVQELKDNEFHAEFIKFEAEEIRSARKLVEKTIEMYGRIDVVVNNVGGSDLTRDLCVENLDIKYFEEVLNVNLRSMIAVSQAAVPNMREHGGGAIVNVASVGGMLGNQIGTLYGVSKAGVINLTRYIATQFGRSNIRCNAVAPGLVLTPAAMNNLTEDERKKYLRHNSLPYAGKPEDIANIITFLASDEARYITGQTIVADGGLSCKNPTL